MKTFPLLGRSVTAALAMAGGLMLALPDRVAAHGIPFVVGYDEGTEKITVAPEIYKNFAPGEQLVYDSELDRITNDGEPGWDRETDPSPNELPLNTRLNIRFLQPLQYWNPSVAADDPLPTPNGTIRVYSTSISAASEAVPSGITGTNPRFLAQFTNHHHVAWVLENPDPYGLYGLWARLESEDPVAFNAAPSDPFLIVLNYGITELNGYNDDDYNEGVDRLAVTAVPEPSTLALVAAAMAAAGWRWCRARTRRRPGGHAHSEMDTVNSPSKGA